MSVRSASGEIRTAHVFVFLTSAWQAKTTSGIVLSDTELMARKRFRDLLKQLGGAMLGRMQSADFKVNTLLFPAQSPIFDVP